MLFNPVTNPDISIGCVACGVFDTYLNIVGGLARYCSVATAVSVRLNYCGFHCRKVGDIDVGKTLDSARLAHNRHIALFIGGGYRNAVRVPSVKSLFTCILENVSLDSTIERKTFIF